MLKTGFKFHRGSVNQIPGTDVKISVVAELRGLGVQVWQPLHLTFGIDIFLEHFAYIELSCRILKGLRLFFHTRETKFQDDHHLGHNLDASTRPHGRTAE